MSLLVSFVVGYLFGSLSGARIVGRRWAHGEDLSKTKVILDGTGSAVVNRGVSPSSLQARSGARGGLRAGAIDISKAFVPTMAAALIWPAGPEAVFVAAGALVGHVYPVYHRFVGGFGISPLLGGLLVIDPWAALVSIAVFAVLGLIAGSAFLGIETWPLGLVAWFALLGRPEEIGYAALANLLYWWRSREETVGAWRSFRADDRPWSARIKDFSKYPDYERPDE